MSGLSVIFRRASNSTIIPNVWDDDVWPEEEAKHKFESIYAVLNAGFSYVDSALDVHLGWYKYSTPSGGSVTLRWEGVMWALDFVSMSIDKHTEAIYGEIAYAFAEYHHHAVERYEVATEEGMFGEHTTITVYVKD